VIKNRDCKLQSLVFCILLSLSFCGVATQDNVSLIKSKDIGIEWQLQAKKAGLANILDEVSRIGMVRIHYSALPPSIVSVVCVGSTIELILKCLLGSELDMVFRYEPNDGPIPRLIDVWIIGSTLVGSNITCDSLDSSSQGDEEVRKTSILDNDFKFKKTLKNFEQGNSKQRALALADLITNREFKKDRLERVLQKASNDKAEIVRVQALFGYVSRFGVDNVGEELQQAFQDSAATVRLKVVEFSEDPLLLFQASSDENELVRSLAQHKLDVKIDVID